jgi:hypothetical protein
LYFNRRYVIKGMFEEFFAQILAICNMV